MRVFQNEYEEEQEQQMYQVREELRFSETEVEQFRSIFRDVINRSHLNEHGEAEDLFGFKQISTRIMRLIPSDSVRRLLRSLGVKGLPDEIAALDKKVADHVQIVGTESKLDFT